MEMPHEVLGFGALVQKRQSQSAAVYLYPLVLPPPRGLKLGGRCIVLSKFPRYPSRKNLTGMGFTSLSILIFNAKKHWNFL